VYGKRGSSIFNQSLYTNYSLITVTEILYSRNSSAVEMYLIRVGAGPWMELSKQINDRFNLCLYHLHVWWYFVDQAVHIIIRTVYTVFERLVDRGLSVSFECCAARGSTDFFPPNQHTVCHRHESPAL
jgi:hypothetical protein